MRRLVPVIATAILAACASQQTQTKSPTATALPSAGFSLSNLDRGANACTNFYQFANGGWLKSNPIPAAYSRWGNFSVVETANLEKMHTIL
ncbi:MAG TPA: hypothetical protein VF980_20110, partial [Thermoanaerobaculia bacterium]